MPISEAQELFILLFAIYFTLIIDRASSLYNPYDTYEAWKYRGKALRRLILSWTFLHILPLLNFAIFYIIIGLYNISFNSNLLGIINIILVGILAFFDFGYYRIFEGFLYLSPQKFFTEKEKKEVLNEKRKEFRAHMIPGVLYVVITWLIFIILLIINSI